MITDHNWVEVIKDPKCQKNFILKMRITGQEKYFATDTLSVMDVTSSYKTGTVTVTNLSKALTFADSSLLGNVEGGDYFRITSTANSPFYKIKVCSTNFTVTLIDYYKEATGVGLRYEILTDFEIRKFLAGLFITAEISSSINLDTLSSVISSISIGIDGKQRLQDIRATHVLSNMTAELGLIASGQTYQNRLQLGEGAIRKLSWGDDETPFKFSLVDLRKNLDRKFPSLKITSENFSSSSGIGNSYPVLYGSVVESPCYYIGQVVTNYRWLVSGHDMNAINTAYHDGASFNPTDEGTATDGDGNTYYYIETDQNYTAQKVTISGNGVKNVDTYFSTAGEIIENIISNYSGLDSGQIDSTAFGTAKNKLGNWIISSIFNGYGTSEATAFDTIQKRLSPQLPIIPVWRNGKYGIIVIDLDNIVPICNLRMDKNIITRVGNISETDVSTVKNSFEINYGYNPRLQQTTKYKKLSSSNNKLLQLSKDKYGLLEAKAITSTDIQDDSTADRLLEFKAKLFSEVKLLVTYLCKPEASIVEEGDFVTVTDSLQGWTNKYFICIGRKFTIDTVKLTLREVRWEVLT